MSAVVSTLRTTLVGFALALVVAMGALLERLFPSASALGALGLLKTLALPLASLALELAVLGGVPLGFAVGIARLGAGLRSRYLFVVPAAVAAAGLLLARQVDVREQSPGAVVSQLIAAARQQCASGARQVEVPILKMTLDCAGQRLHGPAPLGNGRFVTRELRPSSDLSELSLGELELDVPLRSGPPRLRVQAREAVLRGLPPWGRPRDASNAPRLLAIWLAAWLSAAVAGALSRVAPGAPRAALVGLGAGLALALAALALDRSKSPWLEHALLPVAGVAASLGVVLALGLVESLIEHLRTLPLRRRRRAIARAAGRW